MNAATDSDRPTGEVDEAVPPKVTVKSRAATVLLSATASTWRIRDDIPDDCESILRGELTAVIAFWHFQMLPLWYTFRRLHPAAIVSPSNDGGILARWLLQLGYGQVLRGSSSRGGGEVLSGAVGAASARCVLVTPDGPRGPARQAKPGAIVAALRAGVPLVVAGWRCRRVIRFGSWDAMEAPAPFARVDVRYARFDLAGLSAGALITPIDLARLDAAIDEVCRD